MDLTSSKSGVSFDNSYFMIFTAAELYIHRWIWQYPQDHVAPYFYLRNGSWPRSPPTDLGSEIWDLASEIWDLGSQDFSWAFLVFIKILEIAFLRCCLKTFLKICFFWHFGNCDFLKSLLCFKVWFLTGVKTKCWHPLVWFLKRAFKNFQKRMTENQ